MVLLLILGLVFLLGIAAGLLAQNARIREIATRVARLEARRPESFVASLDGASNESPLAGVRVELAIRQDHPLSPFETLLAEALARVGAVRVEQGADLRIAGTLKGNGYADVYFDADLAVEAGGRTILRLREWPPHGDRPENLAREVVARLAAEWAKRERQRALRELR